MNQAPNEINVILIRTHELVSNFKLFIVLNEDVDQSVEINYYIRTNSFASWNISIWIF